MATNNEVEEKTKVVEEKQNTEEVALQDVRDALIKLREALPKLTKVLGGSITDLVGKLQNCLPEPPPRSHSNRRHQRRYHTVGVTPEEVAKAKEWIKQNNCQRHELIRMKFEPVDYKAGCFMEPAPQAGVLSYIPSPTFYTEIPEVTIPPVNFLSHTPEPQIDIPKEIPQLIGFVSNEGVKNISSSDDDETLTSAKNSISSHRSAHIKRKLKRSNTLEVPRHNNFDDSQDELMYNSDQSETKRNTPNFSTQKSDDHDSNKSDDAQKYLSSSSQEDQGKVHTYNPSARGGKHWSNRFSRIKTAFEELSSDEKEMVSPNQKSQQEKKFPWNDHHQNHKLQAEKKLPWNDNPKPVHQDFPVYPSVPVPSNQFTHAPLSRFKPVEKKNNTFFPSSVSGTVKQLVSQKFSLAKSDPQLNEEKPLSFTQRTLARFRPKKQKQLPVQVAPSIDKNKCYTYTALNQPKPNLHINKVDHNYIPKNYSIDYSNNGTGSISKSHKKNTSPSNNYTFNFDYDGVQARFQGIPAEKSINNAKSPIMDSYYQPSKPKELMGNNYSMSIPEKEYNTYVPVSNENLSYQMNIPPGNVFYNNTSTSPRISGRDISPSYGRPYYNDGEHQRNFLQKSPSAHDYFAHKGGVKPDDFSNDVEFCEKMAVGRIMGEAQKRSVAVINPLVRSLSGLLPPKKPSAGHSLSKSPNTLKKSEKFLNAPDQPKIIHKSESCHQLVAQYLPPVMGKGVPRLPTERRNSEHTPKDKRNSNPSNVHLNQLIFDASGDVVTDSTPLGTEDLENVDEAFESIFKESNRSQSCK